MGGAWRATVHGVARSQTQLSNQHVYASLFKTWLNPSQRPLLRCAEEPRVRPVGKPTPLCPSRGSVSPPLCAPLPLSPSVTFDPCGTISASPGAGKGFLSLLPTGCPARKSISEQAPGSTLGPASSPSAHLPQPLGHPLAAGKVSNASPTSSHGDALVNLTRAFFLFIRFLTTYYV